MIRTIFVWSCIVLSGLFFGIFGHSLLSSSIRRGDLAHHFARLWGKTCLLVNGVRVKVEGLEQIRKEGPYIFMSNHQGSYDIFSLLGYLPFQFKWLAKKEAFFDPGFRVGHDRCRLYQHRPGRDPGNGGGHEQGGPEDSRGYVRGHLSGGVKKPGWLYPALQEGRIHSGDQIESPHRSDCHRRKPGDHTQG